MTTARHRATHPGAAGADVLVTRHRHSGIAVLGMTLALVVAAALITAFVNRSLVFGQRSAANQLRATRAAHAADAGFDWAVALLNDGRPVNDACGPGVAGPSFRKRYLGASPSGAPAPAPAASSSAAPSCKLGAGILVCVCPAPGAAPSPVASSPIAGSSPNYNDDTRFAVGFEAVPGDPSSVVVTAHGCTDPDSPCSTDDKALQGVATVRAVLTLLKPATAGSSGTGDLTKASSPAFAASAILAVVPGTWHDD